MGANRYVQLSRTRMSCCICHRILAWLLVRVLRPTSGNRDSERWVGTHMTQANGLDHFGFSSSLTTTHRARLRQGSMRLGHSKKEFVVRVHRTFAYTRYKLGGGTTEQDVLAAAEGILRERLERQGSIGNPTDATNFLRMRLGALLHEEFHVLWLDNRHRILDCQKLFTGTVDGASIYPREVVRAALSINPSTKTRRWCSGSTRPARC